MSAVLLLIKGHRDDEETHTHTGEDDLEDFERERWGRGRLVGAIGLNANQI